MENHPSETQTARVRSLLAEVFQVPVEAIVPDLAFGDLPEWNSLGHMDLMVRLEEAFGIPIDADTIAGLVDLPAICARVAAEEKNHARPA